jgi:CubicO group peptidase (beta-lactamase class C family)
MDIDAGAAGMDADRLARIEEHLVRNYIDPGKLSGCLTAVMRHGELAYLSCLGLADRERGRAVTEDTIWRIYSMTKPITGVALMTLYERGHFQLSDPVHRYIPRWRELKVRERLSDGTSRLVDPIRPPSIRDVMMHTSGIGYGQAISRLSSSELAEPDESPGSDMAARKRPTSLEELVDQLADEPLHFQPGTHWLYSYGIDVCARLVEIISGCRFDDFLQAEIFSPLEMEDTGFAVGGGKVERFAANYARNRAKELVLIDDPLTSTYLQQPSFLSGGGGLVSTAHDYLRFCKMLANGGEIDGTRVLGRKTVELMTLNHLPGSQPGGGLLTDFALPGSYGEVGFEGMGFGLTVAVTVGQAAAQVIGSTGEFMWGGAASTLFWVDPAEDLVVLFMTQLMPSGTFNFRGQLKTLVYPAIAD